MIFREKQQIILSAVFIILVGGFVMFRYLPLRQKIKVINQAKAAQRSDSERRQFQGSQIPVLEEQALGLEESIGDYEARIPQARELGLFLGRITDLMNEHNLSEQVVTPGGQVKSEELNCIPVEIQCKGDVFKIFGFFRDLQSLERLVRIEHVKLMNDADFGGVVTLNTRAIIYFRDPVSEAQEI